MKHRREDVPRVGDKVLIGRPWWWAELEGPGTCLARVMTGARGLGVRQFNGFATKPGDYVPINFKRGVRGVDWCRGWTGSEADAFRAAHAL